MKKLILGTLLFASGFVYSYTITHNDYAGGNVVSSSGQNTNENAIVTVINGNLDSTNIIAGGIRSSNVLSGTLIGSNFTSNTISGSSANDSSYTAGNITTGTVSTVDLRTDAVTVSSASLTVGTTNHAVIFATATITTVGGVVLGLATTYPSCTTAPCTFNYALTRGNAAVRGGACQVKLMSNGEQQVCAMQIMETPTAGTTSYLLSGIVTSGTGLLNTTAYSLSVTEIRR